MSYILHEEIQVVHTKHLCCTLKLNGCLRNEHGTPVSPERTTDRQTMIIQTWVFHRHFSKMNKVGLSFQVKQPIVYFANDKIQAFKWKLEVWKMCICQHELDSFPIWKDFSDEIGGDMIFLISYNEMYQQRAASLHELVFSEWTMQAQWDKILHEI